MSFRTTTRSYTVAAILAATGTLGGLAYHSHAPGPRSANVKQAKTIQSAGPQKSRPSTQIDSSTPYVQLAKTCMANKQWSLAEKYLAVAFSDTSDLFKVTNLYIADVDHVAQQDTENNEFHSAFHVLQNARMMAETTERELVVGRQPLNKIVALERVVDQLHHRTQRALHAEVLRHIKRANQLAADAYSYVWFNDRNKVRQGLVQLRWVFDYRSQLSDDDRAAFFQSLNTLKSRVSDKEWASLLAAAGYQFTHPVSSLDLNR